MVKSYTTYSKYEAENSIASRHTYSTMIVENTIIEANYDVFSGYADG